MVTEIIPADLEAVVEAPVCSGYDIVGCEGRTVVAALIDIDEEVKSDDP